MTGMNKILCPMTVAMVLISTLLLAYLYDVPMMAPSRGSPRRKESDGALTYESVTYSKETPSQEGSTQGRLKHSLSASLQDLEKRKTSIAIMMSDHVVAMETCRKLLLGKNEHPWIFPTNPPKILYGYQTDYFEKLLNITQVTTLYMEEDLEQLDKFLVQEYYDYSSNDCELLQRTAIKGLAGTNSFKPACHSDIVGGTRKDSDARRSMLSVGLPNGIQHSPLGESSVNYTPLNPPASVSDTANHSHPKDYYMNGTRQHHLEKVVAKENESKHDLRLQYAAVIPRGGNADRQRQGSALLTYLHVVEHGMVFKDGNVISGDVQLVPFRCHITTKKFKGEKEMAAVPVEEEIFTIAQFWGGGFFHGTIENLPRLALYYDFLQKHPNVKIHVANRHPFLTELLGISSERLITGDVRGRVVYVPAGNPCGLSLLASAQALSVLLRSGVTRALSSASVNGSVRRDTIVLIRRSSKRFFKHHDAILKMLQRHARRRGLDVVVFGDRPVPSLHLTASFFGKALIVVAPHGAGESNILFSQPGTVLIEGLCFEDHHVNLCYRDLALSLGLRYYGLAMTKNCFEVTDSDIEKPYVKYLERL